MKSPAIVTLLPVPVFLIEVNSERLVDLLFALRGAGFELTAVPNTNRYRVQDAKKELNHAAQDH